MQSLDLRQHSETWHNWARHTDNATHLCPVLTTSAMPLALPAVHAASMPGTEAMCKRLCDASEGILRGNSDSQRRYDREWPAHR
jgi:hypothetical protein